MAKTRRNYTGNAISTTTAASIAASGTTSFTLTDATGWPYGSAPFYVVVEPGSSSEEKMLVTRAGSTDTTLSVYSTPSIGANRGLDGTSAVSHSTGSTIYPVFTAADADEANEMASTLTAKGDLITHGTSTFAKLAVGTNNYVLVADSAQTVGIKWGQVQTAGIADDAVTAAKIANNAVGTTEITDASVTAAKLASNSVETAKITDLNVTTGKLADGAVATAKLADGSVTAVKIAASAVTASALAANSVVTASITDSNVTTAKINDGAVTTIKIADGNVTAAKLAANAAVPSGVVSPYAGSTAPTDWLLCDGSAVSRSTYATLFAVLGTTYGVGNGTTTFNLPDMRSRFVAGKGTGTWSDVLGETGGSKDAVAISHFHDLPMYPSVNEANNYGLPLNTAGFNNRVIVSENGQTGTPTNEVTYSKGSSGTDRNLPPYITLNYIIKT